MGIGSMLGTSAPWVIVAGGFHQEGATDKLNAALARYLIRQRTPVHLVGHHFAEEFADEPAVRLYRVAKVAGSFFLGERMLDRTGRMVAARVSARDPATRVLVNGANCAWPALNWVHFLHHAEPRSGDGGPLWIRAKSWLEERLGSRRERAIIPCAPRVIANSERTRRDLINQLGARDELIVTVYPGSQAACQPGSAAQRASARRWLGLGDEPVVAFVGALRHDDHKGFGTLWRAWRKLCTHADWRGSLVVAGAGRKLEDWRRIVAQVGLARRVVMLGHTSRVAEVLAASDLLVSPTRYDAYGLGVHEAICCGVPAIVSGCAGVAERYPAGLQDLLLNDPKDAEDLAIRLLTWSRNIEGLKRRFETFGVTLRASTDAEMASRIASLGGASLFTKMGEMTGSSSYTQSSTQALTNG
jgi:glycosyltransferase involved in cell wall biosynthesis